MKPPCPILLIATAVLCWALPTPSSAQATAALGAASASSGAVAPVNCDKISDTVRKAVEKDPTRVLRTVEDFMVSNESCACEIVKAAVLSSHANGALRHQIGLTATDIAPQQRGIINDCLSALNATAETSDHSKDTTKNVQPVQPADPIDPGTADYALPTDLRGVYFIEPLSGVVSTATQTVTKVVTDTQTVTKVITQSLPNTPSALSPSTGRP